MNQAGTQTIRLCVPDSIGEPIQTMIIASFAALPLAACEQAPDDGSATPAAQMPDMPVTHPPTARRNPAMREP